MWLLVSAANTFEEFRVADSSSSSARWFVHVCPPFGIRETREHAGTIVPTAS
jgi:hypothetical protein